MSFSAKKLTKVANLPPIKDGKIFYKDGNSELWLGDARKMDFIPDNSVQLIVTSPPYNVCRDYSEWTDNLSPDGYLDFTRQWLKEAYRVLCKGGRLCINTPSALTQSTGSKIAFVSMDTWFIAVKEIGFLPRDITIWKKVGMLEGVTSWGSWCSQSAPFQRDCAEWILTFSKEEMRLDPRGKKSDLTPEEFLFLSKNIWTMKAETRKIHPAPFPLELPLRLIKFYCFPHDTVLDPFVGSGTTVLASKLLGRKGIGIDYDKRYLETAKQRISQELLFDQNCILTKINFTLDNDDEKNFKIRQVEMFGEENE